MDVQPRFDAALQLMRDGRQDEALAAFAALCRDAPQWSGPYTNIGILQAQRHQRDAAIASFNKAVAINPHNAVAYNWLGTLYRESGDYARAETAYLAALGAQPDYAAASLNLAILYDQFMARPREALLRYRTYEQLAAGTAAPIVDVWIHQIETADGAPSGRAVAGAQR